VPGARRLAEHRDPGPPYVIRRYDGRWVRITEQRTSDGGLVGIRSDVTDLVERERVARLAREELLDAVEVIEEGFALYDAADRLVLCNSYYRDRIALDPAVLVPGKSFAEIAAAGAYSGRMVGATGREEAWLAETVAQHRRLRCNVLQQRDDGHWFRINERRTKAGGTVVSYVDITQLVEGQRLLQTVIDTVPAVINVKDRELRYQWMNRYQANAYNLDPRAV